MEILILLAAIATLVGESRRLPLQNVFAVTFLIVAISMAAESFALRTGLPFSPGVSRNFPDAKTVAGLAWPVPLLWLILLLDTRRVAQWSLRNRIRRFYGSAVLFATAGLTTAGFAALLASAGRAHFWKDLPGIFVTSTLILICLTPWLIKKKPTAADSQS